MGQSLQVRGNPDLPTLLAKLPGTTIIMVDNQLVSPKLPPPATWRDVRLKTPAGTVALKRDGDQISITVFGNADEALTAMQRQIADALT